MQKIEAYEYMKTFPKLEKELDGNAMCAMKWIHQFVNLEEGIVKMCHNVPHRTITEEEIKLYGKGIFMNHPYEQERRLEKLNNIKHSECSSCWKSESKGVRSCRLPQPFYDQHRSRFGGDSIMPTQLEIVFSSTCDLKCIYCSSSFSSQWDLENKKFDVNYKPRPDAPQGLEETFWQWLEEDAVEHLLQYYIMGGEPLLQPKVYDFLEKLLVLLEKRPNRFNVKPSLIIITNGHTPKIYLDKWLTIIPKLQQYMSIQMDYSIEGYKERAEYIRSNLNWERFVNNFENVASKFPDIRYRFSITHSAMSITSICDLLKTIKSIKDKTNIEVDLIRTSIANPEYLSPWILTKDFSSYIDETCDWIKNEAPEWTSYIDHLTAIKNSFGNHTAHELAEFCAFHERVKHRRGLDAEEIFPEMQDWIKYCKEGGNV
jgi:sulfatase maturation enzyme AslB (radical SAM superfamily)